MSSYTQLTPRQRYQIKLYLTEFQLSQAEIARRLSVNRMKALHGEVEVDHIPGIGIMSDSNFLENLLWIHMT